MEKLNYELVGKKATIECLLSGEIRVSELSKFYLVDIDNKEVRSLSDDATIDEVMNAINDPNVLFVQASDSEYDEDEYDDWEDEEEVASIKKKKRNR